MIRITLLAVLLCVPLVCGPSGCFTTTHTVGDGPHGEQVRIENRWYAMWGFFPLGNHDSRQWVGAGRDYRITTEFHAIDVFFNLFTGPLGFFRTTSILET